MNTPNDICVKAARIWRTVNKPVLRPRVDAECELYTSETAEEPIASLKVKNLPEVKLLDLILALCALKLFFSAVRATIRLFKS